MIGWQKKRSDILTRTMTTTINKDKLLEQTFGDFTAPNSTLAIKRSSDSSLDDLFGYSASDVEEEKEIIVVPNEFSNLFEKYENIINFKYNDVSQIEDYIIKTFDEVLSPKEIKVFHFIADQLYGGNEHKTRMGYTLTKLIQNSFNKGYNDFDLDFTEKPVLGLGNNLKGKLFRKLKIKVKGNLHNVGHGSRNLDVTIDGNASGSFGFQSKNITAYISGCVNTIGYNSKNVKCVIGEDSYNVGFCSNFFTAVLRKDLKLLPGWDFVLHGRPKFSSILVGGKVDLPEDRENYGYIHDGVTIENNRKYQKHMQEWHRRFDK